jgi:hypothetical protein
MGPNGSRAERVYYDEFGGFMVAHRQHQVAGMLCPVECVHCHQVYDLTKTKRTGRWADADAWITPCCKRNVVNNIFDPDRKPYIDLDSEGRPARRR